MQEATQLVDSPHDDDEEEEEDIDEATLRHNTNKTTKQYKWHMVLHQLGPTRRSLIVPDSGTALTLGRDLLSVRSISRTHASVQRASNRDSPFLLLRDLGSSNGTFVLADSSAVVNIGADRSEQDPVALDAARRELRHRLDARVDVLLRNCDLFRLGPDVTFQVSIERVAVNLTTIALNDVSAIMHSAGDSSASSLSPPKQFDDRKVPLNDTLNDTLGTQRRPLHSFGTVRSQEEPHTDSTAAGVGGGGGGGGGEKLAPLPNLNDTQSEELASIPRTLLTQTQLSGNKTQQLSGNKPLSVGAPGEMLPPQARPPVIVLSDVQTQPVIVLSDATQPPPPLRAINSTQLNAVTQAATQAATLMVDDSECTEPAEPAETGDSARTVPLSGATQPVAPPPVLKRGSGTLDAANAMELLVTSDAVAVDTVLSDDETVGTLTDNDEDDDNADWVETKRTSAQPTPQPPVPEVVAKPNPHRSTAMRAKHRTPLDDTAIDESDSSDAPQRSRAVHTPPPPPESSEESPVLQLKLPEPPPDEIKADAATMPIDVPEVVDVPAANGRTGRQRRRPVRFVQSLDADEAQVVDEPPVVVEPPVRRSSRSLPSAEAATTSTLTKRKSSSIVQSSPPEKLEEEPKPPKRGRRSAAASVAAAAAVVTVVEDDAADEVVIVEEPVAKRGRRASNAPTPPAELERKTSDGASSSRRSTRQSKLAVTDEAEVAPRHDSMSSKLVFLMTACDQPSASVVQTLSDTLPLRFTDDPTDGVTHVVTEQGLSRRTEKILCAFAVGEVRAVVSPAYLTACKRARQLLPESTFAVVDKQTERRLGPLQEALNRAAQLRGIGARVLENIHFWLTPRALALAPIAPRVIACGRGTFHGGLPTKRTPGVLEVVIAAPDELAATWKAQAAAGFGVYEWHFVADTILAQRVDWNAHFVGGERPDV
jgi:pSer/pThr/pTyr-binding forkhead associated (FHA) protein